MPRCRKCGKEIKETVGWVELQPGLSTLIIPAGSLDDDERNKFCSCLNP